ncbi:PREDICTED: putative late blight resistance protein homolog R1A-10 [Erythranthe guttata]|uniref:putative late blight resistance protein homolog R1A-10 n=1 Tax=Erythranthe guttata TaxID=4155 RepID=UPI00064DFDFA|nr:PREDICTED: putative late blight resistance protein homolog R1A-10 [Erythranthe guttata]|eukprot:XP_012829202.1 PREDICTED: putative late blight resistance protein homolog R1A-10 [Erythranthe guttata]
MAYGAVCCLELTIDRLLKSSHISINVQNSSHQILKHLYDEILSLKEALGEFDKRRSTINMKMVKTLEAEIIDAIYEFEDVIDSHLSNQFHSPQSEEETDHPRLMLFSVDLHQIKQDVDSVIETVNEMKRAYIHELCNPSPEDEDDVVPSINYFDGHNESNMVGLSRLFTRIKDRLVYSSQSERMIVSLYGMAGIGKTTLANKLFQDPFISNSYDIHVFVTIGPKYRVADILVDILTQMNHADDIMLIEGEKKIVELKRMVFESLNCWRYLIVLDDVWDKELFSELVNLFPDQKNGSRVLLTTRLREVAQCANYLSTLRIPFLDKKESWALLRHKVFDEMPCPHELEKPGKKIAENCEGLPLTIITVANILSKADKTIEYWNEVADDKKNSVYKDAYDQMSKVLYPSYDYLDQHLKACFLYLGSFPQNHSVHGYQLINLWSVEGFLNPNPTHYSDATVAFEKGTYAYLDELHSKNVIMYHKEKHGQHLHSSFWYMCNKEAAKTKFFYAFNCRADALPEEGIKYQRRLCIRNNILFAIEDVKDSMASAATVRSLLCTGVFQEYPVPLCLEHLRLLRVLEAISIRFYEFPMEVLKLAQLRYLALTYDGNLPTSISKLWNLQHLIVDRHLSIIKSGGNLSYLPIEIWNMKELKHIQTMGSNLPHPCEGSLLPNLLKLRDVGPQSCTKDVLQNIPNMKELAIKIELPPDATEPLRCFDHISHLHQLGQLECYIMNPILKTQVVSPLAPLSDLPSSLTMLTLSGLGYPWEEMNKISSLPNLRHLKLKCYAFRGPKWEVHDNEFQRIEVLNIEDTDLVHWKFVTTSSCFYEIKWFSFEHCYKLKEIPLSFGTSLEFIDVVECNPMAVNCAKKLKKEWDDKYGGYGRPLDLNVRSSL